MASETNNYCTRLNLPVPRLEDFLERPDLKLFDLMIVALLEHGGPLPIELLSPRVTCLTSRRFGRSQRSWTQSASRWR